MRAEQAMNGVSEASKSLCEKLDRFSLVTSHAVAWLTLFMVIVTFAIVVLRYVFDAGFIWLQESLLWMHGVVFMLGAAYTLQQEGHVRVDIYYRDMNATRRAWVDLLGVVFFVFPLCGLFFFESWDYAAAAWSVKEISRDAGGLLYPAIPLLKSVLLMMPAAVALQGLALALNSLQRLRRR